MTDRTEAERLAAGRLYIRSEMRVWSANPPKTQDYISWLEAALNTIDARDAAIARLQQERDAAQQTAARLASERACMMIERDAATREAETLSAERDALNRAYASMEYSHQKRVEEAETLREEVGRLRASLMRVRASFRLLLREVSDPGAEALAAEWEAGDVLARTREAPAQPATDDVERARESKENTHQRYYLAFHDWFMSGDSSCDFWSECDAPEALATIAVEIHDAALTAASARGRAEQQALDADVVPLDQCPACHWHPGHEPEEWFREESVLRGFATPTGQKEE